MNRSALFVLACLFQAGCASLNVEVAIFDRTHWSSPEYHDKIIAEQILRRVSEIQDGTFFRQRDELLESVTAAFEDLAAGSAQADRSKLKLRLKDEVRGAYERARKAYLEAYASLRESRREGRAAADVSGDLAAAMTKFSQGSEMITSMTPEYLMQVARDAAPELLASKGVAARSAEVQDKVKVATEAAVAGIAGDAEAMMADPRASEVIYAPEPRWQKVMNQTTCKGKFGNTDCAVKMETVGSFTIKGVRLDSSRITQASFAAARTSLQLIAALSGAPLPGQGQVVPAVSGESAATPLPDVAAARSRRLDAEATLLAIRRARLALIEAVIAQSRAVEGGDQAKREQALKRIDEAFKAQQPILNPSTPPATTM